MASSGSYNMTSPYGTIRVEWWVISQSTSGNYSRLGWRAVATWSTGAWYQVYSCNIWINGAQVLARGSAQTWGGQFANGEINVGHNSDGTKSFSSNGNAAIYTAATNASGSGSWALPTIARWASLTAFSVDQGGIPATDESALWVEFSNPAGLSVTAFVEIIVGGSIVGGRVFNNSGVGSRHNFAVNTTSRELIQSKMPNTATATIRIGIQSTISGTTVYDYRDRTITIANGSGQANPIFTDFSYKDSNAATVAITGNNQYIIQGHSTLQATVLAANKMVARKLATPSNYRYQIGSIDVTQSYAATDIIKELGVVGVNTSTPLVVTARDSRNFGKAVSKTVFVVPYLSPQLSGTAERVNNFETSTKISITGVISRLTIGGVDKNAVNTSSGLQYRYKKADTGTWGAWQNITSSTSGANVSMTDFYVDLDRNFAWNVQVRLIDKLTTSTLNLVVSVGIPIFRIGANGLTFNRERQLKPSVGGIVDEAEVGTIRSFIANGYKQAGGLLYKKIVTMTTTTVTTNEVVLSLDCYWVGSGSVMYNSKHLISFVPSASGAVRTNTRVYGSALTTSYGKLYITRSVVGAVATIEIWVGIAAEWRSFVIDGLSFARANTEGSASSIYTTKTHGEDTAWVSSSPSGVIIEVE